QNPVVSASAQIQFAHGYTNQFLRILCELTVLLQLTRRHAGIAIYFALVAKPFLLALPGLNDPLANGGRRFLSAFAGDVAVFHRRHFNVQIDSIEQWAGDALTVTLHLDWAAAAFALEIGEITARAGIHCGNEHELGGKRDT